MSSAQCEIHSFTLLVIEDDPTNLRMIVDYLETFGFQVVVARDGESGLKRANVVQPDLILLDVMMPGINGFETCRCLKADDKTRDIPIIFMTALEDIDHKVTGFEVGGVDYISKPIRMQEALARIKTHLRLKTLTAQLRETNETLTFQVEERTAALTQSNKALQAEIVERRQVEASLRASEERYRALYSDNPSMFFTIDDTGIIISVNLFGAFQLGYTVDELEGQSVLKMFYVDDTVVILEHIHRCLQHPGQIFTWQCRKIRKDGSLLWVEEFARAMCDPAGRLNILIVCHDITERKQTEQAIQRRNRELALFNRVIAASVSETKAETILEITCRELTQAFNLHQAVATLLNEEKTEVVIVAKHHIKGEPSRLGQIVPVADSPLAQKLLQDKTPLLIDDAQNDPHLSAISRSLEGYSVVSFLLIPLIIDGEVIGSLGLVTIAPGQFASEEVNLAQSVASQVAGVLARLRLDTQRQQLQLQYYQAQKMEAIGQLAGGIAHDLNNLLVPIIGYVELGMMDLAPDDNLYRNLGEVQKAAERATDLTRQILAFSRKQVLEMRGLDLNTLVEHFKTMIRRLIGEDIELQTFLNSDLYRIKADKGQIEQVLLNLVVNARDAMPTGGKLAIETANAYLDEVYVKRYAGSQAPGHYVMLAVSDTGCGMDAATQQQIFEPFFTTKALGKGTGLGLSTVFGIVRQHGGNIWVYSEPGKGATFKIYLPQAEECEAVQDIIATEPTSVCGTETVLVIEDEDMVRKLVCETLAAHGYAVLDAPLPNAGLQLASYYNETIHLLLTDVIMPEMNGRELYQKVTVMHPEVKVLYMSGYTDNVIVHHGILDEGVNFLQKPFTIQNLVKRVKQVLS